MPKLHELDEAELIESQGWNDSSLVALYREFVADQNLDDRFRDFLLNRAADERGNGGGPAAAHLSGPTYFAWLAPETGPVEISEPFATAAEARAHRPDDEPEAQLARLDHFGDYAWVDGDGDDAEAGT